MNAPRSPILLTLLGLAALYLTLRIFSGFLHSYGAGVL